MRATSVCLLALVGFAVPRSGAAANFIVVLLDDLGADKVGAYADDMFPDSTPTALADTPSIDALAAAGLRFTTTYANPVCSPTRATLLTGRYAFEHDIGNIVTSTTLTLSTDEVTIPEMLADVGGGASYESAAFGKWHLGLDTTLGTSWITAAEVPEVAPPGLHGFDAYKGSLAGQVDDYYAWQETSWPVTLGSGATGSRVLDSTEWASDPPFTDAYDWITSRGGSWFVYLPINAPHSDATGDDDVWEDDDLAPEDAATCVDRDGDGSCSSLENYLSLSSDADRRIGDLLADLMATDPALLEDTVIIVLGDNGSPETTIEGPYLASGERETSGKSSLYESGIRIPFVLTRGCDWMDAADGALDGLYDGVDPACADTSVPMVSPGRAIATPVTVADVYATIAELAASPDAPPDTSVSLVSCLESGDESCPDVPARPIYTERFVRPANSGNDYGRTGPAISGGLAIRQDDAKIVATLDDSGDVDCLHYEFYDLTVDPYETNDLRAGGDTLTTTQQAAYDALWLALRVDLAPDWLPHRNCEGDSPWDDDGDGYEGEAHGGYDCDDTDAAVNPAVAEVWYDGVDQNCDGASDYDQDGDGYAATAYGGTDCDDTAAGVHPGARETWYDGVDQNCDGRNDYDRDNDGYTSSSYGGTDCADTNAAINPGRTEVWYNGVDQDCDGHDDYDQDFDGYRSSTYGGTDCADTNAAISPGATEAWYDGVDQNCDGHSDYDQDGDGYDATAYGGTDCLDTDATAYVGAPELWYDGVDQDCAGGDDFDQDGDGQDAVAYGGTDCDDTDPTAYVGALEVWYDGVDSDCAGDDDFDQDADGFASADYGGDDCDDALDYVYPGAKDLWYDGIDADCAGDDDFDQDRDGYADNAYGGTDCDDLAPAVHPGAKELWYDGVDSDCAGDDDYDADADGHPSADHGGDDCDDDHDGVFPGAADAWYDGIDSDCAGNDDYDQDGDGHASSAYGGDDCDDDAAGTHPGATDAWYDGVDADCAGNDDYDRDRDGYRSSAYGGTDCNDINVRIHPGALEVWYDGVDQNCDGLDDYDRDGDGYRSTATGGTDCNDANPRVNPAAIEIWYDGLDQNCDGADDYDRDRDGYRSAAYGGTDCNDVNARIHPGALELRGDGIDQNCNGSDKS